jgi:hypothetical protein
VTIACVIPGPGGKGYAADFMIFPDALPEIKAAAGNFPGKDPPAPVA